MVLRNSGGPFGTIMKLLQISWAWRRLVPKSFRCSIGLVLFALLVLSGFAVAGIFSAQVSKAAGSSVLIQTNDCGSWSYPSLLASGNLEPVYAAQAKVLNDTLTAASYARTCYGTPVNARQCPTYAKQQLDWTVNANASCPFNDTICNLNGTNSYQMDTGPINSHSDLGINAVDENRITYRKATTCAPLHTGPFFLLSNTTRFDQNYDANVIDIIQYFFMDEYPGIQSYTYAYNVHTAYDNVGYTLE